MGDTIENNSMCYEDNRNKNTDPFTEKINNNENSHQNDENNEQDKLSNDRNQIDTLEEHTQRSRDHQSDSQNFIEEENKKNIYRLGNSDTGACKECMSRGDKWFMQQYKYGMNRN
jgi:hypothetical protein